MDYNKSHLQYCFTWNLSCSYTCRMMRESFRDLYMFMEPWYSYKDKFSVKCDSVGICGELRGYKNPTQAFLQPLCYQYFPKSPQISCSEKAMCISCVCVCVCVCACVRACTHGCVNTCISAQSCLTLCDPMDCSPPGSSAHGVFHTRILEWAAIPLLQGVFLTQGSHISCVSCIGRRIPYHWCHLGRHR